MFPLNVLARTSTYLSQCKEVKRTQWMERCTVAGTTNTKQCEKKKKESLSPIAIAALALTSYHSHISLSWFQPHPLLSITKSVRVPVLFKAGDPPSRRATVLHLSASPLVCLGACVDESALKNPGSQWESYRARERGTGERQKSSKKGEGTGVWDSYEIHPSYLLTASLSSSEPQYQVRDKQENISFLFSFFSCQFHPAGDSETKGVSWFKAWYSGGLLSPAKYWSVNSSRQWLCVC